MDDPALATLFLPLLEGHAALPPSASLLFLRARAGYALAALQRAGSAPALTAEQSFRPHADALAAQGVAVVAQAAGEFDAVALLAPRQRTETRALLARALEQVRPGGLVFAAAANNAGAGALAADIEALAGPPQALAKHKCRVLWLRADPALVDTALARQWRSEDEPQPIADGRFLSRPGLFAWDRIDAASALLAAQLPSDLAGQGADLGAGYGYLAAEALSKCKEIQEMHLYEAEARALDLARRNLASLAAAPGRPGPVLEFFWHDVSRGLPQRYDFIVSNPPFHQGRADAPELGRAFIRAAAAALRPQGRLLLVANRHLPYEQVLRECFKHGEVLAEAGGFKVIAAREPRA